MNSQGEAAVPPTAASELAVCKDCGATNDANAPECWLCHQALPSPETSASVTRDISLLKTNNSDPRISVACLLSLMALVVIGVGLEDPGLGIALAVVLTPAVVRTLLISRNESRRGRPQSVPGLLAAMLGSLFVVVTIGVAAAATFFCVCFAGFFGGVFVSEPFSKDYEPLGIGMLVGGGLGVVAGICVAYILIRRLWPKKKHWIDW